MKVRFDKFGNAWPPAPRGNRQEFTLAEKQNLERGLQIATECSAIAVQEANDEFRKSKKLLDQFFARPEDLPRVKAGLQKMHAFLMDANRVITFVDARGQSEKLLRFCERQVPGVPGRHGAKETVLQSTTVVPMTAGDYAYVKTLNDKSDTSDTEAHQGSGMRIYIGERGFHPSKTIQDTAATVYHEIDHKVLGTVDHAYKVPDCKAIANTAEAVQCADSWALFVTAYQFTWPDLDWDPKDMIVTRARSNAVSKGSPSPVAGPKPAGPVIGGHRGPK